jgi:tetratricopeptide (TPR) repeat protein
MKLPASVVAIVVGLAALFAYFNSLHGVLLLDDPALLQPSQLRTPLGGTLAVRPVVSLSFTLNYWLDGMNLRGYHVVNVLIHYLAALTLFAIVRLTLRLPRWQGRWDTSADRVALFAALVWFLHPVQTQAVTYLIQRCEALFGLFFLVAFACSLQAALTQERRWYIGAVVALALAAGCKEMGLVLPVLVLLYEWVFLARTPSELRRRLGWYALLSVPPVLGIGALAVRGFFANETTVGFAVTRFTPWTYALTQSEVVLHYLRLLVWPTNLCFDYLDWLPRRTLLDVWPALLTVGAILALASVGVVRRQWWGFLIWWYALTLAPTSTIIPIQDAVVEHRLYLPSAGITTLLVIGVALFAQRFGWLRPSFRVAALLLVVTLGVATAARNEDYSSATRMWTDAANKRPDNARAWASLLEAAARTDQAPTVLAQLDEALRRRPDTVSAPQLAQAYLATGEYDRILRVAKPFADTVPPNRLVLAPVAIALYQLGQPAEAEKYAEAAHQFNSALPLLMLRAACAWTTGRPDLARARLEEVLGQDPDLPARLAQTTRTAILHPDATPVQVQMLVRDARWLCFIAPQPEHYDILALALARAGDFGGAVEQLDRALAELPAQAPLRRPLERRYQLFVRNQPYTVANWTAQREEQP